MPTRQEYHQRLLYLSDQMIKLERLGFFDQSLNENINEEYKDETLGTRFFIMIGTIIIGSIIAIVPAVVVGFFLGIIAKVICNPIFLKNLILSNPDIANIIYGIIDFGSMIIIWIFCIILSIIIGVLICNSVKKSSRQKKIENFAKNSQKIENNLKEGRRIYENIREDLINHVPIEYRNSKGLRQLSDCFALYNISSIQEAVELIKSGKV